MKRIKNVLKSIKKYALGGFYLIVIIALLFFIALEVFLKDMVVDIVGYQINFISHTGSMEPQLYYNDLIVIKKYDFNQLEKGDIITFLAKTTDGKTIRVTHTVNDIYVDPDTSVRYVQTKGINAPKPDSVPVTDSGIDDTNIYIGKMAYKNRFLGQILSFIRSPIGLTSMTINIFGIVIIYIIIKNSFDSVI